MVLHAKTAPLRALIKQANEAPLLAKMVIVNELASQTVALLSSTLHTIDELERRILALERFPELPPADGSR